MTSGLKSKTILGFFVFSFFSPQSSFASYEEILKKAINESPNSQPIKEQLQGFEQQFKAGGQLLTFTKDSPLKNPLSFTDYSLDLVRNVKTPVQVIDKIMPKMFHASNRLHPSPIDLKFNLETLGLPLKEIVEQLLNQIQLINATDFETTLHQAQAFADAIDKIFIPQLQRIPASTIKNATLRSVIDPRIVIAIGDQDKNFYQSDANNNFLLIIDFGGNDTYHGAVAAAKPPLRAGIVIDLAGNDRYLDENGNISQGAAVSGFGMLVDAQGDDIYVGSKRAQGYGGRNSVGILWDKSGHDRYVSYQLSQGSCGNWVTQGEEGFGMLFDSEGNDIYYINNNPGDITSQAPQAPGFSVAYSQGVGIGDKGIGILLDLSGNDVYSSTVDSQGTGWNQGLGILYDEKGNDLYIGVHYVMGASAHRGFGAFFDLSGEDRYYVLDGQGAGASSDTGMASFIDGGSDNDVYFLKGESGGTGTNNSLGTFIDERGNDFYYGSSMGRSDIYANSGYEYRGLNLGIFIDVAGVDFYSDDGKHGRQDINGPCIKTESGSEETKRHPTGVNGLFCDW